VRATRWPGRCPLPLRPGPWPRRPESPAPAVSSSALEPGPGVAGACRPAGASGRARPVARQLAPPRRQRRRRVGHAEGPPVPRSGKDRWPGRPPRRPPLDAVRPPRLRVPPLTWWLPGPPPPRPAHLAPLPPAAPRPGLAPRRPALLRWWTAPPSAPAPLEPRALRGQEPPRPQPAPARRPAPARPLPQLPARPLHRPRALPLPRRQVSVSLAVPARQRPEAARRGREPAPAQPPRPRSPRWPPGAPRPTASRRQPAPGRLGLAPGPCGRPGRAPRRTRHGAAAMEGSAARAVPVAPRRPGPGLARSLGGLEAWPPPPPEEPEDWPGPRWRSARRPPGRPPSRRQGGAPWLQVEDAAARRPREAARWQEQRRGPRSPGAAAAPCPATGRREDRPRRRSRARQSSRRAWALRGRGDRSRGGVGGSSAAASAPRPRPPRPRPGPAAGRPLAAAPHQGRPRAVPRPFGRPPGPGWSGPGLPAPHRRPPGQDRRRRRPGPGPAGRLGRAGHPSGVGRRAAHQESAWPGRPPGLRMGARGAVAPAGRLQPPLPRSRAEAVGAARGPSPPPGSARAAPGVRASLRPPDPPHPRVAPAPRPAHPVGRDRRDAPQARRPAHPVRRPAGTGRPGGPPPAAPRVAAAWGGSGTWTATWKAPEQGSPACR
jgi:hypothetical protein